MRQVESTSEFLARYEVRQLDRIDRQFSSIVLAFPDGVPVDRQQELADAPILAVAPAAGPRWIGVFDDGGYGVPPAAHAQVIGWPDEVSLCVVKGGSAWLVRTDEPTRNGEIAAFPICDVLVVPDHELGVFADLTNLIAYGREGIAWRSRRLALDDLKIVRADGDVLHVAGFFGSVTRAEFTVDLRTGGATGVPYGFGDDDGFGL